MFRFTFLSLVIVVTAVVLYITGEYTNYNYYIYSILIIYAGLMIESYINSRKE